MPTEAQLRAESWWGREVITPELRWLATEICARTNRPLVAAGTKGDRFHLSGAHRSQEWILKSRFCTSRTYTVQPNLTAEQLRQIAGFDFTPGSAAQMIAQSKRLMAALKAGRLEEVREFYGNINGDRWVDGWDNLRDRAATSDDSHLWHWHLSIDRRKLRDRALMERILATALGDTQPEEDDVELGDQVKLTDKDGNRYSYGKVYGQDDITVNGALGAATGAFYSLRREVLPILRTLETLAEQAVAGASDLTPEQVQAAVAAGVQQALDTDELADAIAARVPAAGRAEIAAALREVLGSVDEQPISG